MDVELVLDAHAELGEAPVWDATGGRLLWVDITGERVHRFDPSIGEDEAWEVGQPVGAAVPTTDDRIALAVSDGFALVDPTSRRVQRLADVETEVPETVMNDGKCDPSGRFWAGTRDVEGRRPLGSLYRLNADRTVDRVVTGVILSNGIAWSPDGATMYYIDSMAYAVDAFAFDAATGSVSQRRRAFTLPEAWGLPDGMTVDEEGFLWVAFWGGSALRRFDPKCTGARAAQVVELRVSQVTSCAFGGDRLDELYVTSAATGLTPEQRSDQPHAGGIFRLRPGVRGVRAKPFRIG